MPVDLVSVYEEEFYRFYESDVIYFPLKSNLDFKDTILMKTLYHSLFDILQRFSLSFQRNIIIL